MWSKDWLDIGVVFLWISVWALLVYFMPLAGV